MFDQLGLAQELTQEHGVQVVWGSLESLAQAAVLVLPSGQPVTLGNEQAPAQSTQSIPPDAPAWSLWAPRLFATPDDAQSAPAAPLVRISAVYFRAGYTPDDYQTDAAWATRRNIERSDAVKVCAPPIDPHTI